MALAMGFYQTALHNASLDALSTICQAKRRQDSIPSHEQQRPSTSPETQLDQHVIPAPKLFQSLFKPSSSSISREETDSIPSVGECATHLLLLEAFYNFRAQILQSTELDSLFGIVPSPRTVYRTAITIRGRQVDAVKLKDTTFADRRKVKWMFFRGMAAVRFQVWLQKVDLAISDLSTESGGDETARVLASLTPPLGTSIILI